MTRFDNRLGAAGMKAHVIGAVAASLLLSVSTGVLAQTAAPAATAPVQRAPATQQAPVAGQAQAPAKVAPQGVATSDIVARAGTSSLTRDDVRSFAATLSSAEQDALAADPALFSQTLRVILANQLVLKEANAKNWPKQPVVAAQLQRARDNAIVESYLQSVSDVAKDFPSEDDLKAAYEANKAALTLPRRFLVAQIFIASPEAADRETQEKAKKKLADTQAKLKQPNADFAATAKADSDERASAERGGEIGWVAETQLRPEIKSVILGLEKDAVSEPISVAGGWHIVKVLDKKDAGTAAFTDVRDALTQRMRAQAVEANRRAYLAKLLEQSPPTINEIALSGVLTRPRADVPAR